MYKVHEFCVYMYIDRYIIITTWVCESSEMYTNIFDANTSVRKKFVFEHNNERHYNIHRYTLQIHIVSKKKEQNEDSFLKKTANFLNLSYKLTI